MRAFIFSLDAFVAFTLVLLAIYSLIFFSSIPSSYYYLLTQGHYLSRDALLALSTTMCTGDYAGCESGSASLLDNIVAQPPGGPRDLLIRDSVGKMVPDQFGYVLEMNDPLTGGWESLYDTSTVGGETHARSGKRLSVSSQTITFGYAGNFTKPAESIYGYPPFCNGGIGAAAITCGDSGSVDPSSISGDLVPSAKVRIVRLRVFI